MTDNRTRVDVVALLCVKSDIVLAITKFYINIYSI